jgi:peptidoglycan-N-acetylglucosamine deacetylase
MKTLIACLTFDFDAMSGLVARGLTTPTPISRGEFGAVAVPRILDLLKRHDIKATFFVPGVVVGTYPKLCERIVEAGHEIGNHGWTHVPPSALSLEDEQSGLTKANEIIKKLTGRNPAGYRSPSWDLGPHTLDLLLRAGFVYESSMMGDDHTPYRVRQGDIVPPDGPIQFGPETKLIEMPISWSLDDFPHFEVLRTSTSLMPGLMNAAGVLENWLNDFEYMRRSVDWGVLTYTCHPYVIGRGHRMMMLENLVEGLIAKGATFATMEDAAAQWAKRAPAETF